MEKELDLEDRLINFGDRAIKLAKKRPKTKVGNYVVCWVIRSGTSPSPNYGEAQSAESRVDFIHKIELCLKELHETRIWILMIVKAGLLK